MAVLGITKVVSVVLQVAVADLHQDPTFIIIQRNTINGQNKSDNPLHGVLEYRMSRIYSAW